MAFLEQFREDVGKLRETQPSAFTQMGEDISKDITTGRRILGTGLQSIGQAITPTTDELRKRYSRVGSYPRPKEYTFTSGRPSPLQELPTQPKTTLPSGIKTTEPTISDYGYDTTLYGLQPKYVKPEYYEDIVTLQGGQPGQGLKTGQTVQDMPTSLANITQQTRPIQRSLDTASKEYLFASPRERQLMRIGAADLTDKERDELLGVSSMPGMAMWSPKAGWIQGYDPNRQGRSRTVSYRGPVSPGAAQWGDITETYGPQQQIEEAKRESELARAGLRARTEYDIASMQLQAAQQKAMQQSAQTQEKARRNFIQNEIDAFRKRQTGLEVDPVQLAQTRAKAQFTWDANEAGLDFDIKDNRPVRIDRTTGIVYNEFGRPIEQRSIKR